MLAMLVLTILLIALASRDTTQTMPCGVEILKVHPNTPAESASLRSGDVITGFNGVVVQDFRTLDEAIEKTRPGAPAEIIYIRGSDYKIAKIILATNPEEPLIGYIGVQITTRFTDDPSPCYKIG